MTATATRDVRECIFSTLKMDKPDIFELATGRTNIFFDVVHTELMSSPLQHLYEFLEEKLRGGGSAIVYVRRKDVAAAVCAALNSKGMPSLEYHRGLTDNQCQQNQDSWMQNQVSTMVATIAFGLGIDKKDVRSVVEWGFPADMPSYFQEAGRAGRDGKPSWCRLYSSAEDRAWYEGLLARQPQEKKLINLLKMVQAVESTNICRHSAFAKALESIEQRDGCDGRCDVCYDRPGLEKRAKSLHERASVPRVNRVADRDDKFESSENEVCPVESALQVKFDEQEVYEPILTVEDKPIRRLGRKQENDGSIDDEGENIAEYFRKCGNCEGSNLDNIFTHLKSNDECLKAYSQSIFAKDVSQPQEKTLLELALVMGACIEPDCQNPHYGNKNLRDHLRNDGCRLYYHYFTRRYLGSRWEDATKVETNLVTMLRSTQKKTSFKGSSNEPFTARVDPMRRNEAERKKREREDIKRKNTINSSLAMRHLISEQAEVLKVPCALCRHQFSRPHRQQATSAIKRLCLDSWGEVDQRLRSALQGATPEKHLLFDDQYWICSACEKNEPPTERFDGNLQIFQRSQDKEMFTLRAVPIFDIHNNPSALILAPSKFPTLDIDGDAAVLEKRLSSLSVMQSFVMLPADILGVDAFKEEFPSILTRDWTSLAKFQAKQNILPGIYTLANNLVNYHRAQIHRAKLLRGENNQLKVFGVSRVAEDGTRTLDQVDFTQKDQSNDANAGEPEKEKDDSGQYKGALSNVAGTDDYFDARSMEHQSKSETFGAVRLQMKTKLFDGKIDGKIGSSLVPSSLVKVIPKYDENNHMVDFDCYLRCTKDSIKGCTDDCEQVHFNLDHVSNFEDQNYVLKRLPLLARHVSASSENFIRNVIQDRVMFYDFWHQYEDAAVYLVGNVWPHQYESVNADIAAGKLPIYIEATERVEEINRSSANPMVPTATLNMETLFQDTQGTVKNLGEFQNKLEKKQTSTERQGWPSMIDFFPKHRGKFISHDTATNVLFLVKQMVRDKLEVSLEECLDTCLFREESFSSADEFKFSFRIKSLTPKDTTALFKIFTCKSKSADITGQPAFDLCKRIVTEEENTNEKKFSVTATPLLLYDALQKGKGYLFWEESQKTGEDIEENRRQLLSNLSYKFHTHMVEEVWKEVTADRKAVESLRSTLQQDLGSDATKENSILLYHTALDIHQSWEKKGYTCKRTCQETYVKPYEAFTSQAFEGQCEAKVVIKGDEEWTYKRPPVIVLQEQRHFQMPILQLAQLKSFGKATNRFSNCGQVRYVDLRDGAQVPRRYREVRANEDVGNLQIWKKGNKRFVLDNGYRSFYLNLPRKLKISLAEFCAWYDRSTENMATIEELQANNGFSAPEMRNERERILVSENETTHKEALLPRKILLKDNKTTFNKRNVPVALQWGSLGLENEYNEKALFSSWKTEEQIQLKDPSLHITHIWKYFFDSELSYGANAEDTNGGDGGDDRGDGDEESLAEVNDQSILSSEDNTSSHQGPDFSLGASQISEEPMSQDKNNSPNCSSGFSQVSDFPASNPENSEFEASTPLRTSKVSSTQSRPSSKRVRFETSEQDAAYDKRARFETTQQDSGFFSPSGKPIQSQSSDAAAKPSQDLSQVSSSQVEEEYLRLRHENKTFLSEHPVASQRSKEEKAQIQKIKNRMKKISTHMDIGHLLKTKEDEYLELLQEKERLLIENPVAISNRSKAEKAQLYKIYNRMGKISTRKDVGHLSKRKDGTLGSRLEEKGVEGLGEELEVEGMQRLHHPTTKIIQPIEPMEIVPKEQPASEEQLDVELLPVDQGGDGGEEDKDMRKLIKCKQGTREGQKCTDILWIGNLDKEGQFILDRDIKDYFFKYVDEGYQTIWVRATVEVPIQMVSERVCEFFAKKVGMPEPWNTCIASELNITFKGKVEPGQDLLSTYPEKSLFLLSKGPLPEQFKNHKGLLWQCTRKCGKAQNRRDNIIDKKCRHKFLFDKDQPNSMGRDKHRTGEDPMHIPILSRLPASLASLATPQRRVSKSFQLANIVISCSNQLTAI